MWKSVLVAAMVLVLAGCRRDVQSIDEPAPTVTTAKPVLSSKHQSAEQADLQVHNKDNDNDPFQFFQT
jgi:type IV pilus biogenesis protein CpaD/CtpE